MGSIKEEAKGYVPKQKKVCIECGEEVKDYRSIRCRQCWKLFEAKKFPAGKMEGKKNVNWKGNKVGYFGLHDWVRKHKPKPEVCEFCKTNPPKQIAKVSKNYTRNVDDYKWLCCKCHINFDGTINNLNYRREKNGNNKK